MHAYAQTEWPQGDSCSAAAASSCNYVWRALVVVVYLACKPAVQEPGRVHKTAAWVPISTNGSAKVELWPAHEGDRRWQPA